MKKILVIEDNIDVRENIVEILELSDYVLLQAHDGKAGVELAIKENPDLIICDIMMPVLDGYGVLHLLSKHKETFGIPFIFLTAKAEKADFRKGMELGADDYVQKPFSPKVLFSRIKAILRRGSPSEKSAKVVKFSDFLLDIDRYILRKGEKMIPLTLSEFGILRRLVSNRGKVLTRNQLLDDINNDDSFIVDRNIDVHIASLRKKLGPNFNMIETVRGVGYRFLEEDI